MQGAGGTKGGAGQFFIGLAMMAAGFYLLFNAITVTTRFGLGYAIYSLSGMGGLNITSGMVLVPFIFGVGLIFYNSKNILGWLLASVSLIGLIAGVIASIQFRMRTMSAFDLLVILTLAIGGLGLFLRSLKDFSKNTND